MSEEIKDVLDNLQKGFADFKEAQNQKIEELEKKGSVDPLTIEKIDKIVDDVTKFDKDRQDFEIQKKGLEEAQQKLEKIETALARPQTGEVNAAEVDRKMQVFDTWLRKGESAIDPVEKKALYESDETLGGFYAPTEYVADLIKGVTEISPIRSIARIRNTSNRGIEIPKRTGTFAASFVSETATRSETTGYLTGLMKIDAHEMYALVDISNAMLEDSAFNLESEMNEEFASQFAKKEGASFVSGTGVEQPQGFTDSGAGVSSTNSGSGTALTANGLLDLMYDIKSDYMANATFVMNRGTFGAILKLEDTEGQKIFVNSMSFVGGAPNTILGKPYILAEDMPDVAGSAKPVAFGDFSRAYTIVDRIGLSVQRDPFSQATSGNIRYTARRRVGGAVVLAEAIRLQNISA